MQRRHFLAATVRCALGAGATALLSGGFSRRALAGVPAGFFAEHQIKTLAVLARCLFPHRALDDSCYLAVASRLQNMPPPMSGQLRMVRDGLRQLDAAADGSWLETAVDRKLRILEAVDTQPYFQFLLNTTIDVLYRNPDVWRLLGYEGSSLEFGGYLHRGFDDIDWLPERPGQ